MDRVKFYKCDLSSKEQLLKNYRKNQKDRNKIYALINNAAILIIYH